QSELLSSRSCSSVTSVQPPPATAADAIVNIEATIAASHRNVEASEVRDRHSQSLTASPCRALGLSPRPLTSSPYLGRRCGPVPLHSLHRRQKQTEPHLVPLVVVVVVFLLLTVSVSHLVSISPFPALFVAGSRGNRSRWPCCQLLPRHQLLLRRQLPSCNLI
ncbi:hypothetical protein S245_043795, partial [Arachis hypogaea]